MYVSTVVICLFVPILSCHLTVCLSTNTTHTRQQPVVFYLSSTGGRAAHLLRDPSSPPGVDPYTFSPDSSNRLPPKQFAAAYFQFLLGGASADVASTGVNTTTTTQPPSGHMTSTQGGATGGTSSKGAKSRRSGGPGSCRPLQLAEEITRMVDVFVAHNTRSRVKLLPAVQSGAREGVDAYSSSVPSDTDSEGFPPYGEMPSDSELESCGSSCDEGEGGH